MTKLIGWPNPRAMAKDIREAGFSSCDAAELAGWFITSDVATRASVDKLLSSVELDSHSFCERCGYDEVDGDASIPDIWVDRYMGLCKACSAKGHHLQSQRDEA